jgi:hypothetical protein
MTILDYEVSSNFSNYLQLVFWNLPIRIYFVFQIRIRNELKTSDDTKQS